MPALNGRPEGEDAELIRWILKETMGVQFPDQAGIGIKPMSPQNPTSCAPGHSHAIENRTTSVTLMHKGNIMKFTEGAFRHWGYEVAARSSRSKPSRKQELFEKLGGQAPREKVDDQGPDRGHAVPAGAAPAG